MGENMYMGMDLEQLQKTVNELNAASPINLTELTLAREALNIKLTEQVKQERITTAITETAAAVDNLEIIPGMQLRDMCIDEQSYQFVKIAFQTMLNQKDAKYIEEITASAEREANLEFQIKQRDRQIDQHAELVSTLQGQINDLNGQNVKLQADVNTLTFERDEALKVRDNAAAEMEGLKLVVEEKQKQIDTMRTEIAVGAKGAVQIDQSEQLRQAQEAWVASRIKVTEMYEDEEDLKRATWKVRLLGDYEGIGKDGQLIPINYLEKGKYLKVSQEEAARFRAEAAATAEQSSESHTDNVVPSDALVEIPEVQPVEDFRSEEVGHLEGLDTTAAGQVLPQTLEERVSSLEKKVEILFNNQNIAKTFKDPNAA